MKFKSARQILDETLLSPMHFYTKKTVIVAMEKYAKQFKDKKIESANINEVLVKKYQVTGCRLWLLKLIKFLLEAAETSLNKKPIEKKHTYYSSKKH